MIKPLQRVVGPFSKPIKITALTKMIPTRDRLKTAAKFYSTLVPISEKMMRLIDLGEENYIVPQTKLEYLASKEDINDWTYLLRRFDLLLNNLIRLLGNMKKVNANSVTYLLLDMKQVENRHNKLKEKILERTTEKKSAKAKVQLTDKEKIEQLKNVLAAMGFAAMQQGMPPPGGELDAATLAQVRASGADMIAAAHLATLEASSPQHVTDVMQVILNRARGQSGGIPAVITAREQFTPYSAAIYGTSLDKNAERKYGPLRVTKAEIFQLASQPNGLQALTQRFKAGNPSVAAQVIMDIKSNGPLITSSRKFVGGAQYFNASNVSGNGRRRPDGGNWYRDRFASGAIVLPELFKNNYEINFNTHRKNTLISNFIVDRPTIIDMKDIGEPLIIIPVGRPIGRSILKMLFEKPFKKIENYFNRFLKTPDKKEDVEQIPIKNNTTQITRTTIQPTKTVVGNSSSTVPLKQNTDNLDYDEYTTLSIEDNDFIMNSISKFDTNLIVPSFSIEQKKIDIDSNISQKTSDVFGNDKKVVLLTQEIEVIEE